MWIKLNWRGMLCVASLFASASAANAQSSAWVNTMEIASNLGGSATVADASLGNGATFVLMASDSGEVIAAIATDDGIHELVNLGEDANGTMMLWSSETGELCTVTPGAQSGIRVAVSGDGFDVQAVDVSASGNMVAVANECACSGGANPGAQTVTCDRAACNRTAECRANKGGYCQAGTKP